MLIAVAITVVMRNFVEMKNAAIPLLRTAALCEVLVMYGTPGGGSNLIRFTYVSPCLRGNITVVFCDSRYVI